MPLPRPNRFLPHKNQYAEIAPIIRNPAMTPAAIAPTFGWDLAVMETLPGGALVPTGVKPFCSVLVAD